MKRKYNKFIWIGIVVLVFLLGPLIYLSSVKTIDVVIRDKERITTGMGESLSSKFIVYTEGEVFENTDNLMFFKFNSADVQNNLEPGKTYKIKVAGWRIPMLSYYRNILKIEDYESKIKL